MVDQSVNASVLTNVRRIAVLRALQLGDLMVAVPALRALRQRFPYAEINIDRSPLGCSFCAAFQPYP